MEAYCYSGSNLWERDVGKYISQEELFLFYQIT